jgi:hypothetical protein
MTDAQSEFDSIAEMLSLMHHDVERGKMMSSPGIKCNGKVFAFFLWTTDNADNCCRYVTLYGKSLYFCDTVLT